MTAVSTPQQTTSKLEAVVAEIVDAIAHAVAKHNVSYTEYRVATEWLTRAGGQTHEIPLLLDVFLATAVDNANNPADGGTESNAEGPFYVPGAPRLEQPCVLAKRASDGETADLLRHRELVGGGSARWGRARRVAGQRRR